MVTATAAQRTLGVPELAEAILLDVDNKTLLLAQRVCKTWQQIIKASKVLQQALFLEPTEITEITWGWRTLRRYPARSNARLYTYNPTRARILANPLAKMSFHLPSKRTSERGMIGGWEQEAASYHDMLICQPAVQSVAVSLELVNDFRGRTHLRDMIVHTEGKSVTLGEVITAARKSAYSYEAVWGCIRWPPGAAD